jgi:hypothetical protein
MFFRITILKPVCLLLCLFLVVPASFAKEAGKNWLLIDTENLVLKVVSRGKVEAIYKNISIGRNGAGVDKRQGDEKTPLGEFKIGWINKKSRYRLFFGMNYPSLAVAERGLVWGDIDLDTYIAIRLALKNHEIPPQNSRLGGLVGIHGLGLADLSVHEIVNWTEGCIALTNEQIDSLSHWVFKGMRVIVK